MWRTPPSWHSPEASVRKRPKRTHNRLQVLLLALGFVLLLAFFVLVVPANSVIYVVLFLVAAVALRLASKWLRNYASGR